MPFNIKDFKSNLTFEGARPTLFKANITFPANVAVGTGTKDFTFHCKAAQLPGKTLGMIELPYFGRKIKVAGDLTFAEWTVTVLNEETFSVRNSFERWMSLINSHVGNQKEIVNYKCQASVTQYTKIRELPSDVTYKFTGMWPSDISAIDVAWDSNDQIEEFTVTLNYDWWEKTENAVTDR
jgi:hypothetical protein